MRRWFAPANLPVAIGALLLLIPWLYLTWNTTVGELVPQVRFRTKQTIAGMVQDAAPTLTVQHVLSGEFQRSISRAVGVLSPIFKPAIHWKNQLYYTLLGTSGTDRVVVGRHRQLLEIAYLNEYCARDTAKLRPEAEAWAAQLRRMQDFFDARGQAFAYVITPSKVAQYPQFIPGGYRCPAGEADRTQKLAVFTGLLRAHGVRFVDGASGLAAARATYGIDMFPRGGVHWNALASALATQALIALVNEQHRAPPLPTFTFTWETAMTPAPADRDLLDMMNMPKVDAHYPVPALAYHSVVPPGGCRRATISEVGGSFLMGINTTLAKLDCAPDITYWFYFDHHRFHYVNDKMKELPVDPAERRADLLAADIVLFEENEAALPTSVHGQDFLRELAAMPAAAAR